MESYSVMPLIVLHMAKLRFNAVNCASWRKITVSHFKLCVINLNNNNNGCRVRFRRPKTSSGTYIITQSYGVMPLSVRHNAKFLQIDDEIL